MRKGHTIFDAPAHHFLISHIKNTSRIYQQDTLHLILKNAISQKLNIRNAVKGHPIFDAHACYFSTIAFHECSKVTSYFSLITSAPSLGRKGWPAQIVLVLLGTLLQLLQCELEGPTKIIPSITGMARTLNFFMKLCSYEHPTANQGLEMLRHPCENVQNITMKDIEISNHSWMVQDVTCKVYWAGESARQQRRF